MFLPSETSSGFPSYTSLVVCFCGWSPLLVLCQSSLSLEHQPLNLLFLVHTRSMTVPCFSIQSHNLLQNFVKQVCVLLVGWATEESDILLLGMMKKKMFPPSSICTHCWKISLRPSYPKTIINCKFVNIVISMVVSGHAFNFVSHSY